MIYIYEEYETNHYRRFTPEEWVKEKQIRSEKGYSFFKCFRTQQNLGEVVRLLPQQLELLRRTIFAAEKQTVTLSWGSDDVEKMFLEEKDRHPPSLEEINDILAEFDNEVHDRLTPLGNEFLREIINRS